MSRSLRRGVLAASLVLAVAPLSACAAGNDAATLQVRPDNAATSVGDIEIQNALVIVAEGEGAPASVSATVVNNGTEDETLSAVALDGAGAFNLDGAEGEGGSTVTVPAGGSVLLGGEGNPSATLADFASADDVALGDFAKVTFELSETGEVSLEAHVVPATGHYTPFAPTPQATESAEADAEADADAAKPSGSATPSGAASEAAAGADTPASPNATQGATESPAAGS